MGVVEGAGFSSLRPLAPGGIVSIFGARLAGAEQFATALPLSRALGGTSVTMGAEAAPLTGGLQQGALEQSAVDPAAAMVEMIRLNRLYELSLKVASTLTNDLDARAISDVASTR